MFSLHHQNELRALVVFNLPVHAICRKMHVMLSGLTQFVIFLFLLHLNTATPEPVGDGTGFGPPRSPHPPPAAPGTFDYYILSLFWPPSAVPLDAQGRARHLMHQHIASVGFWTHGLWPSRCVSYTQDGSMPFRSCMVCACAHGPLMEQYSVSLPPCTAEAIWRMRLHAQGQYRCHGDMCCAATHHHCHFR